MTPARRGTPADLRARPFSVMMLAVRYLLALALALQFSGLSTAWAKPCPMATAAAEHACCVARHGGPVTHVSGSCGCQMTPTPTAPAGAVVATAPEGASDHGIVAVVTASLPPVTPVAHTQDDSPPGPAHGAPLSRLSGSGFRC